MKSYYIYTYGCQMNTADSERRWTTGRNSCTTEYRLREVGWEQVLKSIIEKLVKCQHGPATVWSSESKISHWETGKAR